MNEWIVCNDIKSQGCACSNELKKEFAMYLSQIMWHGLDGGIDIDDNDTYLIKCTYA